MFTMNCYEMRGRLFYGGWAINPYKTSMEEAYMRSRGAKLIYRIRCYHK